MRSRWLGFAIVVLLLGFSALVYGRLPAIVPSHWNLHGEPNGYSPRWVAAWVIPLLLLGLRMLLGWLPRIDPLGKNYETFADTYWTIVNLVLILVAALHIFAMSRALGYHVAAARAIPVGVGLAFVLLGNIIGRVRPNWFVGVRTPWTLSSEQVWRKTHRAAAWVFVIGGLCTALAGLLPTPVRMPVTLLIVGVLALVPVVYSYVLWRAEQRDHL